MRRRRSRRRDSGFVLRTPRNDGELLDRRVDGDDRAAGRRRSLARRLDRETVAALVAGLRLVLVGRDAEFLQLAARRLLRDLRAGDGAAQLDRELAALPGRDAEVAGRVLAPVRQ